MGGYSSPGRRLGDPDSEGDASDMAIKFADCALTLNCACALFYKTSSLITYRYAVLSAGIVTWNGYYYHTRSGGNGQIMHYYYAYNQ